MSMLSRFAATGGSGDPYWANVSLLLVGNGGNNTTTNIVDSSSYHDTLTITGNTVIKTTVNPPAISGSGSGTVYFDGSGDWLSYTSPGVKPNIVDFVLDTTSTGTIEFWLYVGNLGDYSLLAIGECYWYLGLTSGGDIMLYWWTGVQQYISFTAGVQVNTWTYIAFVKSASTVTIYVNGVSKGTTTVSTVSWGTVGKGDSLLIGHTSGIITSDLNGYIYDLRITKNVARYTSNFPPGPTSAFPTS